MIAHRRTGRPVRFLFVTGSVLLSVATGGRVNAQPVTQPVELASDHIRFTMVPIQGGPIVEFGFAGDTGNQAGRGGLLQEGFGMPNPYAPVHRTNETLVIEDNDPAAPRIRFSYDVDGGGLDGLRVTRTVTLHDADAVARVRWRVENTSGGAHWLVPWVRNDVAPGGAVDEHDKITLPAVDGVIDAGAGAFYPAARNWAAAIDTESKTTIFAAFDAAKLYAFHTGIDSASLAFTAFFSPTLLEPGASWQTAYTLGAVRGLDGVSVATPEFCGNITYGAGGLELLISPSVPMPEGIMRGTVLGDGDTNWRLARKAFGLTPNKLVLCRYDWTAPAPGAYEFLGRIVHAGAPHELNAGLNPPHGGIDTQFIAGTLRSAPLPAWSDAPHALDRQAQEIARPAAAIEPVRVWHFPSLTPVFREDAITAAGPVEPLPPVVLARNESESFQLALCASDGAAYSGVTARIEALEHEDGIDAFDDRDIAIYQVEYTSVRIPSHFEHATGYYPDRLRQVESFSLRDDRNTVLWITLTAPPHRAPGVYRGETVIRLDADRSVTLPLAVEVFPFALPEIPALKTDFVFSPEDAFATARVEGYTGTPEQLRRLFAENAFRHRITLRDLNRIGETGIEPEANLRQFEDRFDEILRNRATTYAVNPDFAGVPGAQRRIDALIQRLDIASRAFVPVGAPWHQHSEDNLASAISDWQTGAPQVAPLVYAAGLNPPLPDEARIWALHWPLAEVSSPERLAGQRESGRELWFFLDRFAGLPSPNLFIERPPLAYRALFARAWAMGFTGMHLPRVVATDSTPPDTASMVPANGIDSLLDAGPAGPVNTIRWEVLRDGIEDYDYLALAQNLLHDARTGATELTSELLTEFHDQLAPDAILDSATDPNQLRTRLARIITRLSTPRED